MHVKVPAHYKGIYGIQVSLSTFADFIMLYAAVGRAVCSSGNLVLSYGKNIVSYTSGYSM